VAKAAVPMAGRTLIERLLGWLRRQGVRDIVLNLHHRPDTITRIVGDGAHLGLRVRYSWEPTILGSAGGPRHALPLLDSETFLIVNGDTLPAFDLAPMLDRHQASRAGVTLAVVPNPAPEEYNGLVLDARDAVTGFVRKGMAEGSWHFVGVQIVAARIFAPLCDGVVSETTSGLYRDVLASEPGCLCGYRVDAPFVDVGTPRTYLAAVLDALASETPERRRWWHGASSASSIEPGATVDPTARLVRSVVWPDASVERGVDLEECVVAGPVRLQTGFRAEQSVIVPVSVARASDAADLRFDTAVFPF
jgi:NDP-sugar pyrophosphorylase family protein